MSASESRPGAWSPTRYLYLALSGLVLLALCGLAARNGAVSGAERRVFRWINDLPQWLYRPMWVFQQFGNLLVALAVFVLIALLLRKPKLAIAGIGAGVMKLVLERVVKTVVERERPGTSIGDVMLRGDVPAVGLSFVSGHAAITAALAALLTPALHRNWKVVPWAIVLLNGSARIYVGAHNPLDIVGGIGLGLFIGGLLNAGLAALPKTEAPREDAPLPAGGSTSGTAADPAPTTTQRAR